MFAGGFLGTAKSRLLPASVPFRFFVAAALLHIALWIALVSASADFMHFRGGVGPTLAAVHLLTLGVLTMTAIGAAVQLLPVATARPLAAVWPVKAVFWLTVPGALVLIAGMYRGDALAMIVGAAMATLGLLLFAGLLADNLRRAASLPIVAGYGWAAFLALVLLIALGLALSIDDRIGFLSDHPAVALAHMILGGFGFMGLLAFGFSHVLVPMFALSRAPEPRPARIAFAVACAAVGLGSIGALLGSVPVLDAACGVGLIAAALHVWLMQRVLARGMRKRLGVSFVLVRISWGFALLAPLVGLAALHGLAGPGGPALFGLTALGGWLMTFLFAILQRIAPFLASMHVTRSSGGPPLLSELGASWPLAIHAGCHLSAIAGLAAAIVLDHAGVAAVAAVVGLCGAIAFAGFLAGILKNLVSGRT